MQRRLAAALLLLLASSPEADAAPYYQVDHPLYGCVDPQATLALRGPGERIRGHGWARYVRRAGRCFLLTPEVGLEVIQRQGDLVLLQRAPPRRVDAPPVYVMAGEVRPAEPLPVAPVGPPEPPRMTAAEVPPPVTPPQPAAVPPAGMPEPAPVKASDPASAPTPPPSPLPAPPPPAPEPAAVPAPATPPAPVAPVETPVWPPHAPAGQVAGYGPLVGLLIGLLLLLAIVGAAIVARRRKHFAHVEDPGWPPNEEGEAAAIATPAAGAEPGPTPQEFRRLCAAELDRAGWTTQMGFTGGGVGPDIVCKRDGALLVVRCRQSQNVIGGEMVDEAAAMGARQEGAVTALVSNAPFSRRAREEALRQQIHLLRDTELADFGS